MKVAKKQPNSKMCFVCGIDNTFGLKSRFFEMENGELLALFQPAVEHQGYPGRLHGGLAATILDETIGRAIMVQHQGNIWGVTIDFSVKYRKPVPLDTELRVVGRIVKESRRSFEGTGEILLADGTVAIQGTGRYLKVDIDSVAEMESEGEEWFVVDEPGDPTEKDITPKTS